MKLAPTTVWGALLCAAHLIEQRSTSVVDPATSRPCMVRALQAALWPHRAWPEGVPSDQITGLPYWRAVQRLHDRLDREDPCQYERRTATTTQLVKTLRAAAMAPSGEPQ
jgi:hypothetical protein